VSIQHMKAAMEENLRSCYNLPEVDQLLRVVCFLDPRFKRLPFLSSLEQTATHSIVQEEMTDILSKEGEQTSGGDIVEKSSSKETQE